MRDITRTLLELFPMKRKQITQMCEWSCVKVWRQHTGTSHSKLYFHEIESNTSIDIYTHRNQQLILEISPN